jgi:hypothetical protein
MDGVNLVKVYYMQYRNTTYMESLCTLIHTNKKETAKNNKTYVIYKSTKYPPCALNLVSQMNIQIRTLLLNSEPLQKEPGECLMSPSLLSIVSLIVMSPFVSDGDVSRWNGGGEVKI